METLGNKREDLCVHHDAQIAKDLWHACGILPYFGRLFRHQAEGVRELATGQQNKENEAKKCDTGPLSQTGRGQPAM